MPCITLVFRPTDSDAPARLVLTRLRAAFGAGSLRHNMQALLEGATRSDFARHMAGCPVMLVLIGRNWERDPRLHDTGDRVHVAVAAGLAAGRTVIPVLLDGAPLPLPERLPPALQPIAYRPPFALIDFDNDLARLIATIQPMMQPNPAPASNARNAERYPVEPPAETRRQGSRRGFGIGGVLGWTVTGLLSAILWLPRIVIQQMVRSVINFTLLLIVLVVLGALALWFGSSMVAVDFNVSQATALMSQQLDAFFRGLQGG